jgi:mannose-6-phosphate isomerase-like protein (cupin superfamily)
VRVTTPNYDYFYLCPELRRKRMIPVLTRVRAKSIEEFGELVRHPGEEYIHVLEGRAEVHTEFYDPIVLEAGESVYIDSNMGHAYIAAEGCEEVLLLGVCSSADEQMMESMMHMHDEVELDQAIGRDLAIDFDDELLLDAFEVLGEMAPDAPVLREHHQAAVFGIQRHQRREAMEVLVEHVDAGGVAAPARVRLDQARRLSTALDRIEADRLVQQDRGGNGACVVVHAAERQSPHRDNTRLALVPPNPKLFDITVSSRASTASRRIGNPSARGSSDSMLADAAMKPPCSISRL